MVECELMPFFLQLIVGQVDDGFWTAISPCADDCCRRRARSDDVSRWTIVGGGDDEWLNVVTVMRREKVGRSAAV